MDNLTELSRLVYVSSNTIPEAIFDREVQAILNVANKKNPKSNITGALLFNHGYFAQVLEGPVDAVEKLFERIQEDTRHDDCSVLCCESTTTRKFMKWSMAYESADTAAKAQFADMLQNSEITNELLSADKIFKLIVNHISQATSL
ncbi:MAG: hypothetical protein ACI9UT_003633 [Flavobacteriales bacterium]|jgi:hypothetical protein